jgi:hypothetical protein
MSRKLNAAEQNYTVHERELFAVMGAQQEWRAYLLGNKFIVKTDHRPLQYLQTQAYLSRRQARWVLFLHDFHFDWEYVSGASNSAADAFSRQDVDQIHSTWDSLKLFTDPSKPQNVISKGSINAMIIVTPKRSISYRPSMLTIRILLPSL